MDYEYLFSKSLYETLKTVIKGKVFVKVIGDQLVVQITTREGINYERCVSDFAHKLILGQISSTTEAYIILKEYKECVNRHFFY